MTSSEMTNCSDFLLVLVYSFTVLIALFRLMSVALPEGGAAKLSKFEYFTLTLMKLRLNASNSDLAFDLVSMTLLFVVCFLNG